MCVGGGLTDNNALGCITVEDVEEDFQFVSIEAQNLPSRQIFIEFNGAMRGYLRELEVDYRPE